MSKNTQLGNLVNGVYVDSSGNVGMGTQSPRATLDVIGSLYSSQSWIPDSGIFGIGNLTTGASYTYISGVGSTGASSYMSFSTNAGEKMRITSAGNVGIGTSSPLNVASSRTSVTINGASTSILSFGSGGVGKGYVYNDGTNLEIYSEGATIFAAGGPPRMRLTSAGNLGIGASTSPTYLLEVSTAGGSQRIRVGTLQNNNNSSTFEAITTANNTTASAAFFRANAGGSATIGVSTYNKTGGDSGNFANLSNQANTVSIQLASNGNVMVGTETDNGYKLNVSGSIYSSSSIVSNGSMYAVGGIGSQGNVVTDYGYGFGLNSNTQNAANAWNFYVSSSFSNNFRFFYGGTGIGSGSAKFQIDTGGGYTGLSDINKKKDITLSTLGLAEVMQLKPSTFKFKDDENQEEQIGFIAQEVKDIIPQAYYEDKEGDDKFIGLKQAAFIPVLVKAIQELKAEIETLKNK